jgi:ABC-type sugar transport system ATPase subunit
VNSDVAAHEITAERVEVMTSPDTPLLEARGIVKAFGGAVALRGVDLTVSNGEIVGLVGANGAGKSTLTKIIAGVYKQDEGQLFLDGNLVEHLSPLAAMRQGIVALYQRVGLIETLTTEENLALFLSSQQRLPLRESIKRARTMLASGAGTAGLIGRQVESLNPHGRQLVQALKARILRCRVLLTDETSVALSHTELVELFAHLRALSAQGTAIIYISHTLEEVIEIAHRIVVIRDGRNVDEVPTSTATTSLLARLIIGSDVKELQAPSMPESTKPILEATDVRLGTQVRQASLRVAAGEIVGLTGLEGSGRRELGRIIGGMIRADSGTLALDGRLLRSLTPNRARRIGIMYVTSDRGTEGLMVTKSAAWNIGLALRLRIWGWLTSRKLDKRATMSAMERFSIVPRDPDMPVDAFSGGNQQRLLLAMAFARTRDVATRVLILDDPTVGVDVGARQAIHALVRSFAARGTAVIVSSFDVPELMALCHRICVLRQGAIHGQFETTAVSGHQIFEAVNE